ncbi:hypothetical protein THAOC_35816 [Thalassiosira oceanica]|uniref:Uncharacterized protein n=1 Tax=Thalassiosira oceanica TaxID=159749 RepID=K0R166_THAOC|nr:hypothetical protein THAOC_35816 [Thalassiosira oceanica]|eukprot:EJK45565.1 hypothetical protein THAOC_35816 [Thalassiosira oceanica]
MTQSAQYKKEGAQTSRLRGSGEAAESRPRSSGPSTLGPGQGVRTPQRGGKGEGRTSPTQPARDRGRHARPAERMVYDSDVEVRPERPGTRQGQGTVRGAEEKGAQRREKERLAKERAERKLRRRSGRRSRRNRADPAKMSETMKPKKVGASGAELNEDQFVTVASEEA